MTRFAQSVVSNRISRPASTRTAQLRDSRSRGFTLIELLVVIAIIAILASILFPVFARARENARRASCSSNLKQIGLAFMQYSQDYDETYPGAVNYALNTGDYNVAWDVMIAPYLGFKVNPNSSPLILQCPSDAKARNFGQIRSYSMTWDDEGQGWAEGLGSNPDRAMMGGVLHISNGGYYEGRKLSEVSAPAETLMVVENPQNDNVWANNNSSTANGVASQRVWSWGPWVFDAPTHFDGYNYLFADGHVKWLRPERTIGTGDVWWEARGMWTLKEGD